MTKKTSLILLIIALLGVFAFEESRVVSVQPTSSPHATIATSTSTQNTKVVAAPSRENHMPSSSAGPSSATSTIPARVAPTGPHITITVGSSTYLVAAANPEHVLDAMASARADGLTYTGENYGSLGLMVDTINGVGPQNGDSWFLYINGTSSDIGASSATVNPGDTVEWRYEKSY